VRWDYPENPARKRLYNVVAALNKLKQTEDAFSTTNFNLDVSGFGKRIHLFHQSMDVVIAGNFGVEGFNMAPGFTQTGTWYDYFSGEAIEVSDINQAFFFAPGQYHLYTSQPLETPEIDVVAVSQIAKGYNVPAWPNPFSEQLNVDLSEFAGEQARVRVLDLNGRTVCELFNGTVPSGRSLMNHSGLSELRGGIYLLEVITAKHRDCQRIVKTR
jgi:hypothetical protein